VGARYSDRFFGPDAAAEPAAPPSRAETVDVISPAEGTQRHLSAGDAHERPGEPPWHAQRSARAALAAAMVLGAVGGAYGWDQWRDQQAASLARSTVNVSSDASVLDFGPDGAELTLSVRVQNDGAHPVKLHGFRPLDPRLTRADPESKPVELAPAEDTVEVMSLDVDCQSDGKRPSGEQGDAVAAQVTTVDGAAHEVRVAAFGLGGGSLTNFLSERCSYLIHSGTFQDSYPEVLTVERSGPDEVSTLVVLQSNGPADEEVPEIHAVNSPSAAFTARWDVAATDERLNNRSSALTVVWSVRDCVRALEARDADMELEITGRLPSDESPSSVTGYPTPGLVAELVRLSESVCR